jgi:hypothetical protein
MKFTKSYLKQVIKEELEGMKGTAGENEDELLQRLMAVNQEYMRTRNAGAAFEFSDIMKQLREMGVGEGSIAAALRK